MAFRSYQRDYDDYFIEIGDRVQITTEEGSIICGICVGRGAAGNYLKIRGDNGGIYEGYSSDPDVRKIFSEEEEEY